MAFIWADIYIFLLFGVKTKYFTMETYRSGHNEPDSKSGSPQGLVGSNPTVSARRSHV